MMKRFLVFLLIILFPSCLVAQQYAEYNRKGDEAMKKKDFYDARFWYSEGVEFCDMYSIRQLTSIWQENQQMRRSMRNIMGRCYTCLHTAAQSDNLEAINQLIIFCREGIGTEKNEMVTAQWEDRKRRLEAPRTEESEKEPRQPMSFFVGYSFSTEMPFGLTIGGLQSRMGWYATLKSNFSFMNTDNECRLGDNGASTIIIGEREEGKTYAVNKEKSNKKSGIAGSAGLIFKTTRWLNLSIGAGYGERTLFTPFHVWDNQTMEQKEVWMKNQTYSYKGVLIEMNAMTQFNKFFVSAGCHSVNFEYIDLNVSLGMFF